MEVLELRKVYAHLYKPSTKVPALVDVPPLRFLMLDGVGDVGGPRFQASIAALYGLSYPIKFAAKKELEITYQVPYLEGLYWDAEGAPFALPDEPERMAWRLMIMLPEQVPGELVETMREKVAAKKDLPRLDEVQLQTFSEGRSVQVMHIGPYEDEGPTVQRLMDFAADKCYEIAGLHHEIYVTDPGRTAPEKLKTVLRYGVRKAR